MNFESLFKCVLLASVREKYAPVDLQNGEFVKGDCTVKGAKTEVLPWWSRSTFSTAARTSRKCRRGQGFHVRQLPPDADGYLFSPFRPDRERRQPGHHGAMVRPRHFSGGADGAAKQGQERPFHGRPFRQEADVALFRLVRARQVRNSWEVRGAVAFARPRVAVRGAVGPGLQQPGKRRKPPTPGGTDQTEFGLYPMGLVRSPPAKAKDQPRRKQVNPFVV